MIKLQGLHKYFNKGRQNELHVLNDISLSLPESGMVAVFGRSGCGKTTLLNVIGGLDGFAEGSLSVDGMDIRRHADLIRNRSMGYIFQNYNLHKDRTCFDNVADALRLCGIKDSAEIDRRVRTALACVDMARYGSRTPDTLSGGQQQRIAIARAIVKNPRIILADEPTGNLDEANTLMIMDLLKQISRDHLVLLVTHEANLVDYYCDTVIELKDGQVESIRENDSADGMVARNKNHIYLGELPHTNLSSHLAQVEYYGDAPEKPISLRIVNKDGKIYVQVNTEDVRVLDGSSEIRLKEGSFDPAPAEKHADHAIDMTDLPPLEGSEYGKLFRFGSSVKSGYTANFKKQKKGKSFLLACLCLFAAVAVFATAIFGTVFGDIANIQNSYSHNTFYVYTPTGDVSDKLLSAYAAGEHGIDALYMTTNIPQGDNSAKFITGYFETFSSTAYDESFRSNAVYLPRNTASAEVLAGRNDGLSNDEILISRSLADALLETSSLGYIARYEDLVGLTSRDIYVDGHSARIAGVVQGDERAVYVCNEYLEEGILSGLRNVKLAENYRQTAQEGEVIVAIRNRDKDAEYPAVGETLKIRGKELRVSKIIENPGTFEEWMLKTYGIDTTIDPFMYFEEIAAKEFLPEYLTEDWMTAQDWINTRAWELCEAGRYDYMETICAYLDEYMELRLIFSEDHMAHFIYREEEINDFKYNYYIYGPEYYRGKEFRELHGYYPTNSEKDITLLEEIPHFHDVMDPYYRLQYIPSENMYASVLFDDVSLLVNVADHRSLAYRNGESTPLLLGGSSNPNKDELIFIGGSGVAIDRVDVSYNGSTDFFTVIHTANPEATDAFLRAEFSGLTAPNEYVPTLLTPQDLYDNQMEENGTQIFTGLVTIAVLLALLCVCMYFIMRSALMSRIKEVGIWRAIGVSRRNLCFRFFVEALVLTSLTVLVGYLASSLFVTVLLSGSSLMSTMLYYPMWLAGTVLAILYLLSALCGTLPILSLMRKTPSAILAKYDI